MTVTTSRRAGGFTLIELLVVIAIISILSSVVLASLGSARQRARDGRRVSDMKQIQLALELYYDTQSRYPVEGWNNLVTQIQGTFISIVPNDPTTGNSYGYYAMPDGCNNTTTKCTGYYIGAIMETTGQVGVLVQDNDADTGANMNVNGADLNCNENATGGVNEANERLYCSSSL